MPDLSAREGHVGTRLLVVLDGQLDVLGETDQDVLQALQWIRSARNAFTEGKIYLFCYNNKKYIFFVITRRKKITGETSYFE